MSLRIGVLLALSAGCGGGSGAPDIDGDGAPAHEDCDDYDGAVYPGADEICDGSDNNCDGVIDVDAIDAPTWYVDADGDGFGETPLNRCEQPSGTAAQGDDCDDADPDTHPGADEICDGVDNDCDGAADDEDPGGVSDGSVWYADGDLDTFGDPESLQTACAAPEGYVAESSDCDDTSAAIHPEALEICDGLDNDCDASSSEDGTITSDGVNYDALQDAVDAAAEGAEIRICDGSYAAALLIERSLTLTSQNGAASTEIDALGESSVIEVRAGDARIEGLTLIGGAGSWGADAWIGGGVNAMGADGLEIVDCVIEGNFAERGGGVVTPSAGAATIRDTRIQKNTASGLGGGVLLYGEVALDGGTIRENAAPYGGGLYASGASVGLDGIEVAENSAAAYGGGLLLYDADLEISGSALLGNSALLQGGGAILLGESALSSDETDWGMGASENSPDDVFIGVNSYTDYGDAATFDCDSEAGGCR